MTSKIRYLNTDLELISETDVSPLVDVFESSGVGLLHLTRGDNSWHASLETAQQYDDPETTIAQMLTVMESLDDSLRAIWYGCTQREFDIGYEGGQAPRSFKQTLSSQ